MYQIHVTYPTGAKGVVCRRADNPDDLEVFLRDEDTKGYIEAGYETIEEAQNVAADVRQAFDDETEVEVVEVNQ